MRPNGENGFIRKVLIVIVVFNFITLIVFHQKYPDYDTNVQRTLEVNTTAFKDSDSFLSPEPQIIENDNTITPESPYKFIDPPLAYEILSQLDVFEPVDLAYYGMNKYAKERFEVPYLGLKNDDEYCDKHRAFITQHPEAIFEEKSVVLEHGPVTIMRKKVVKAMDADIMPHIGRHMDYQKRDEFYYDIDPAVNLFFAVSGIHRNKAVGKHFACLTQFYNHIPGHFSLNRKDTIAEGAINYGKKFEDKPQCFSFDKYFPKTWLLYDKESCEDFFSQLKKPEHAKLLEERKVVYIKKVAAGSHRGAGVTPLHADEEKELIGKYKGGALCGVNTANQIVQSYIHNPLLLNGHKFDFRMYMVIGSTNPLMVFYHDGFLRVSLYNYDAEADDKKVLLTNLALNKEIYDDAKKGKLEFGSSEEELRLAQQWSFDRLQEHLLSTGVISDPNWLNNYLRPELQRAMIHLVRIASRTFLKRSSLYEFYGVDFMLDSNLTLWFIEANSGPALDGYSEPMEKFIVKMLKDHYELIFGLLRSRMKRIVSLVNKITKEDAYYIDDDGKVRIDNMDYWREEFKGAIKNYYEPEFLPSPDNGYVKILDDNLSGKDRYMGLLDGSCI